MSYKQRSCKDWYNFISTNPWKLSIVPKNMITTDMLREAVQKDGDVLEIIRIKNYEYMVQNDIYELAVQNKGSAIEFVPEDCITDRMCHNAIFGSQGHGNNLKFIPKKSRKDDICKEAVNQNLNNILDVPSEKLTNEMYIMAAEENIDLLNHINLDNMSTKIAKFAMNKGFDYKKLPKHLQIPEVLESIIHDIKNTSKELLTKDICKKALEVSPEVLEYIPKEFMDIEMIQILLKHKGTLKFTKEL
jgi:hypothetical protein